MGALRGFIKGGDIGATSLSAGGELSPETSNSFINMVIDQSGFLKRVSTITMRKKEKQIKALGLNNRILVRVPQGTLPESGNKAGVVPIDKTLKALNVQLFQSVLFDTIDDNQDNPTFEESLAGMFATSFSNNIEDLGINGTSETGTDFLSLNKGYIQLAKDSSTTHKVDISTFSDDYLGGMKKMLAAQDERYKANSVFLMSLTDYEGLIHTLSAQPGGIAYLIQGSIPNYMGYEIVRMPFMPVNTTLFTPLTNYVFGMCTDIKRFREISGTKRCIDYTFDMAMDYEFGIDEAVVIGYNGAGA